MVLSPGGGDGEIAFLLIAASAYGISVTG